MSHFADGFDAGDVDRCAEMLYQTEHPGGSWAELDEMVRVSYRGRVVDAVAESPTVEGEVLDSVARLVADILAVSLERVADVAAAMDMRVSALEAQVAELRGIES